ncbi:hypothetical protein Athai_59730 [Actinocatenispora thailandica]|uniref:Uncharacterized protein n=1 Tax=Actinocatenispora thailandica TaxID=227318 RepID=A0A7R7DV76_9ACTN|nr:hypothetical protein [Actinocatenispora thailandica]BCJ38470.1 hypothetical protein Athai_59730 [Actinocatenispora thailandica]
MTVRIGPASTAIGRAGGRRRLFLAGTCVALVLAAIGDELPGYDGPGPFLDLGLAVLVALVWWRYTPLLAAAASVLFGVGGLLSPEFVARLGRPGRALEFAAGWLQLLAFGAAAVLAVAAVLSPARSPRRATTAVPVAHRRVEPSSESRE